MQFKVGDRVKATDRGHFVPSFVGTTGMVVDVNYCNYNPIRVLWDSTAGGGFASWYTEDYLDKLSETFKVHYRLSLDLHEC